MQAILVSDSLELNAIKEIKLTWDFENKIASDDL